MPGNYSIQVRNIDEYTFNKLNEMAEKAGMTREGYLRKMLSNYALSEEIKKVEDKYTILVKNLVEYIQMQGEIIEQNTVVLEELKEMLNLKFINEFKAEQGIKSDKEAFNKIIELYRDSTAEDKNKKMIDEIMQRFHESYGIIYTKLLAGSVKMESMIQILVDVANTLLLSQGIDKCILKDILASEVITQSEDYHKYKAYYCGLCQSLKRQYGSAGQLTLAYDMTFVIILLTSLYESETKAESHRCKMHPLKPQPMLENEITEYAADMNLIMAYYHLEDDWKDEKKVAGLLGSMALKRKVEKAIWKYPRQSRVIREEMAKLSEYESQGIQEVDYPAGCFGRLMEEMMVYKEDCWEQQLRGIGFYLGKYIYIMDAYEDLDKDLEKGTYNPLKKMHEEAGYEERCRDILCMMIGECARNFEILPCVLDVDILRNILYDGVWKHYRKIQEKKSEEKEDDKESL